MKTRARKAIVGAQERLWAQAQAQAEAPPPHVVQSLRRSAGRLRHLQALVVPWQILSLLGVSVRRPTQPLVPDQ